jgi:hypothetical protein
MMSSSSDSGRSMYLPLALACALAGAALSPVLWAGFFGDDFDLWQVGREVLHDPSLAFIGPLNFYRPANAWLFAAHHVVFGTWTVGYHVTTLLMHLGCGLLLGRLLGRFGIGRWGAAAGAAFWMVSPYAFEPVLYVNVSYNDLTVLLVWLGLANLWPGPGGRWTAGRLGAAAGLVAFSVFCKESWVIVAGLAVLFDLCLTQAGVRRAVRTGALVALPVGVYLVLYALVFSSRGDYYDLGSHMFSKVPHLWACFSLLESLEPYQPGFGIGEFLGLALMIIAAFVAWSRRNRLIALGLGWFILTLTPVLAVSWIPTRYTAVPLVGFVLAMAGVLDEVAGFSSDSTRRLVRAGIASLVACGIAVELVWIRGELSDMRKLTAAYDRLLDEVGLVAQHLPTGSPLICVRLENQNLQNLIQAGGYSGIEKFQFVRRTSPYGLASWRALFSFARSGIGDEVYLDVDPLAAESREYSVIGHVEGGFRFLEPGAASYEEELAGWKQSGLPVHAIISIPTR